MTTVYIQLSFEVIGDNAGEAARAIMQRIEDGRLDLPFIQVLRDELDDVPGDWRTAGVDTSAEVR